MRIGGTARYYVEAHTKDHIEAAVALAAEKAVPLIMLGAGSNTVFADSEVNAVVVRIKADSVTLSPSKGGSTQVTVQAGKTLAVLINELAVHNLDLSALTGIPGSLGGALFGNAGQGAGGIWIDSFVESVTAYVDGEWKTFTKEECNYRYRESMFKDRASESQSDPRIPPIIWEAVLNVPSAPEAEVKAEVERLLQRRIETQPHVKTAGSCFKSLPDGTPAWKLIDAAGLRGHQVGGIQVSEKHANFLLNVDEGTQADLKAVTEKILKEVPEIAEIEMRLYGEDGRLIP